MTSLVKMYTPDVGRGGLVARVVDTKHYILFKYGCNTTGDTALPAHVTAQLVVSVGGMPTSMSSAAVHSEPFWASMREHCSVPQLCALLCFGGVHLKHVPASLGQRVPMASACLLVTYIKYVDPAGASSHLHRRRRTSIIMVIQRSESCE